MKFKTWFLERRGWVVLLCQQPAIILSTILVNVAFSSPLITYIEGWLFSVLFVLLVDWYFEIDEVAAGLKRENKS